MIRSFHFVTALATDSAAVHWFCTEVLGLTLVKRTVADDDPSVARLIYGAPDGTPGTLLNFFISPGFVAGRIGVGQAVQVILSVPAGSRDAWRQRMAEAGVEAKEGPGNTLFFCGPDGIGMGLIAEAEGEGTPTLHGAVLASCDPPATLAFLEEVLGLRRSGAGYLHAGDDPLRNLVMVHPGVAGAPEGVAGSGTWHHVAFLVDGPQDLDALEARLEQRGWGSERAVQPWYETLSFHEPGGILLVCATGQPGLHADEPGALGAKLCLPARFEPYRDAIVQAIGPVASGEGTPEGDGQP